MIEILRIKRTEGPRLERPVAIGIGRRIAGKLVFQKIDQNSVEASPSAVLKIGFSLLPPQFRNQRPRRIAHQEAGRCSRILKAMPIPAHLKRKLRIGRNCARPARHGKSQKKKGYASYNLGGGHEEAGSSLKRR
ncbi:hypothetical protein H721_02468 [Brucella ovis IntaBari-2006-46-332]|nr:hypothetical protein C010_02635 [Brucella ovis 80/125]ENR06724.1 hypothetical protein C961_02345 [Brucella ovis F8/05B]ENS93355.1 hypothetical protein B999_02610 [Brucella ovis 63/96]ENS97820.1 hypothetical protein C009_02483 [Brucella ovis 81/8]ENT76155.1 hypothetical protein H712_02613 [Brucella ovis IntaBari-2009-88-4]ENT78398.1 hypothetical protein H720_02404 [Brucella ovis IntaBari-2006-46-348]ENT81947.1 hypothetical protein H713_02616 [Brucella ovis IntaBari-2010-47-268]ENT86539.1 h